MTFDFSKITIPTNPGIYLMKDSDEKIIYIGKAKNLKNRVRSYFNKNQNYKTQKLVENIVIESIKSFGIDVHYMPRTEVNTDSIYGEDRISKFEDARMVEVYIKSIDGIIYTYDVNTNTNYNSQAEQNSKIKGMNSIAKFLKKELLAVSNIKVVA